ANPAAASSAAAAATTPAVRRRIRRARRSTPGDASPGSPTSSAIPRNSARSSDSMSVIAHLVPQRLQPPRDQGLHRSGSAPERLCGPCLGQVLVEAQDDGGPLAFGELEQRPAKRLPGCRVWLPDGVWPAGLPFEVRPF